MNKVWLLFQFSVLFNLHFLGQELSLQQAIGIALKNNYDVQISAKQQEIIDLNNTWLEAGVLPSISFQAMNNNVVIDNTNNPFTFTPGVILNQGISPSLSVDWNIFSGMSIRINKRRFEELSSQSSGNVSVLLESLTGDIMKAYFAAKLQQERVELFKRILEYSRKKKELASIKAKYAKSNSLELFQFQNTYLNDSINLVLQQTSYKNSVKNLFILMNESDYNVESMKLSTDLDVELKAFDFKKLREELLNNNTNLKNQQIAIELQKTATELQKSFLFPTLSLQLGASPNWGWFRQLDVTNGISMETQSVQYFANVNLRYNLFNNYKTKRAIQTSKIQEDIAQLNFDKLATSITQQLNVYWDDFQVRNQLVSISQQNIMYAEDAWELAKDRFDNGLINSVDLTLFENNFLTAQFQFQENLYNRLLSYTEIMRITGNLGLIENQP